MAIGMTINILDGGVPARLAQYLDLRARINPRIGAAVSRLVKDHLFARDARGNKNAWPTQHFYSSAAKATTWTADESGAIVSINKQGFRLQVEGGTVKPVNVAYLTIPARAEAYGKRAREFGNLKIQFGKRKDGTIGPVALVAGAGGATKKLFQGREGVRPEVPVAGAAEGVVMYWLVKEANIPADPTALPTEQEIVNCAHAAIDDALNLINARQN